MFYKSKVAIFLSHPHKNPCKFQILRTFVDNVEIKYVRDRGLDHAVERENELKPMINLKNLLIKEPSHSLPLSTIVDSNHNLRIPCRPIDFIRKYPCVFQEFFPANIGIHPHVRLTPKSLDLDAEERLIFDSEIVRKSAADRLLKLLMLCRVNEIPLKLIDTLKWDLGLPHDYATSLVPEFPDYFQVKKGKGGNGGVDEGLLELVCWSEDMAVSVMEKMAKKADKDYEEGMPIAFPLRYSKGFEMDKKLKKWVDEWQKMPYVSPYENATHLQPNCDLSDRWAVAVLHELLHILVPKKTERENILLFGEYLGVRARLKRAMAHHPGIFYISSKNRTHTVVLREGYKRGLLADIQPLMEMRSKYIHLMHMVNKAQKPKNEPSKDDSKEKIVKEGEVAEKKDVEDGAEKDGEMQVLDSDEDESGVEDNDVEDEGEDEDEDDEEEEEEEQGGRAKGRHGREKKRFIEVNEEDQGRVVYRSDRRGSSKVNEDDRGRGGNRSGSRGFNKGEGQERGGNRSGRGGFNKGEGQERGGNRSGRGGFDKGEGQERGGSRSGTRGFSRANEEGRERGGSRTGRGGFNGANENGRRRDGTRSRSGGYSMVNVEGQGSDGHRSGRRGSSKFGEENSRSGQRSGRRESGKFNEGHARSDDRSGRRGPGKVNEGGRKPSSGRENSPRKHHIDS